MVDHSLKEDGRPAQQWYWDDWFSEFGLRLCSLAARGLWVDMLGIMFKAEIRGTLTVNGRQINGKSLAKILGESEQEIKPLMSELKENDVLSTLKDGTIISRRMYRESKRKEEISRIRSEVGHKGAEVRWQKGNGNQKAKMATSSPSSTPTATSSSEEGVTISTTEKQILNELKKVKGYPYDFIESIKYIRELSVEFPDIEPLEEVKKKVAWWYDHPLKKNSSPHLQLRNWFKIASGFQAENRRDRQVGKAKKDPLYKCPYACGCIDLLSKFEHGCPKCGR